MHITTATAPGSKHVCPGQPGKINNQDALVLRKNSRGYIAVLCDGCGSQPYSGTGADIGAYVIEKIVRTQLEKGKPVTELDWPEITSKVSKQIHALAETFALDDSVPCMEQAVAERFLFTAMILIVVDETVTIASFGDGVAIIDDKVTIIEAPIPNSPPYLGYLLLKNTAYVGDLREALQFKVVTHLPFSEIKKSVIVGTDGLEDLVEEDLHHPALVQSKALQRWLNVLATEKLQNGMIIPGKCQDDVSLVVFRTKESQDMLFEGRREIANLKQKVSKLESDVKTAEQMIQLESSSKEKAEEKVQDLERQLKKATKIAEKVGECTAELSELKNQIETLRKNISPKSMGPLEAISKRVNDLLETLLPKPVSTKSEKTTVIVASGYNFDGIRDKYGVKKK